MHDVKREIDQNITWRSLASRMTQTDQHMSIWVQEKYALQSYK